MNVTVKTFPMMAVLGAVALSSIPAFAADDVPEIVIIGRQLPPLFTEQLFSVTVLDRAALDNAPQSRLDDVLRSVPGFSLFRRQSSRSSHPTTQGVTLRGLGPSGAGRTLVLLDAIPQNDPFGGWIDWSRLPAQALDQVAITRGGGAGQWGNFALAGTINLRTRTDGGSAEVKAESTGGFEGTAHTYVPGNGWAAFATASGHASGESYLVREDQRGPVDIPTESRGGLFSAGAEFSMSDATQVSFGAAYSQDQYLNGIATALSKAKVGDANFNILHDGAADEMSWEFHAYYREQNFESVFVAVNATRTVATPSLDQFRVPATALGGSGVLRVPLSAALTLQTGADARKATGETNELLTFVNGAFTRLRAAGGEQLTSGAFAELSWAITPALSAIASLRADYWQQSNGARRETSVDGATLFINDSFAKRDGVIPNYRAGLQWRAMDDFAVRAVTYSGFRAPTLNELYRPFRVGNDITEANPALALERLYGGEAGFDYDAGAALRISATYFYNQLKNGVGNVTIQTTAGLNPVLNVFVPAGGVLRQRQNIREIESSGLETDVTLRMTDSLSLDLRHLYTRPRISRSDVEPALIGKQLAQVARHQGSAAVTWRHDPWTVRIETRGASSSFEDDQNVRKLAGYLVADFYASWSVNTYADLFVSGENVFDRKIEAGLSADGRVTLGVPQTYGVGIRARF